MDSILEMYNEKRVEVFDEIGRLENKMEEDKKNPQASIQLESHTESQSDESSNKEDLGD